MPIYEYRRKSDGSVFEVFQKISESPLSVCPDTGSPVERIISRTSFQLKGEGWYVTDYKSGSSKDSKTTEKSETSAPEPSTAAAPAEAAPAPEKKDSGG